MSPTAAVDLGPAPAAVTVAVDTAQSSGHRCVERTVMTSDGIALAVRDYQPADRITHTVVLLHGLCLSQLAWHNQIRRLRHRPGIRVIAYDHRGHGHSASAPVHTYTVERLAQDLDELLSALGVTGPGSLAGHSMGGMCALAYLAGRRGPSFSPTGLILAGTAAGHLTQYGLGRLLATPGFDALTDIINHTPHRLAEQAVRMAAGPICAALRRHMHAEIDRHALAAVAIDAVNRTEMATAIGFLRSLKTYDVSAALPQIAADTTVISGGTDFLTPPAHSAELAAAIPHARHIHCPSAGHMLLHDAARIVTTAIYRTSHCPTATAIA